MLYCKGELPEEESALAIVGSRKATDYGLGAAGQFARAAAAEGVPVISGGAYGIDAAAHRAVLDAGGTLPGCLPVSKVQDVLPFYSPSCFFTLTATPSPSGIMDVVSSSWCFNSYRSSRILE